MLDSISEYSTRYVRAIGIIFRYVETIKLENGV